jgi:hypothetical protein
MISDCPFHVASVSKRKSTQGLYPGFMSVKTEVADIWTDPIPNILEEREMHQYDEYRELSVREIPREKRPRNLLP